MNYTNQIVEILRVVAGRGDILRLDAGLSEDELQRAEEIYNFKFPPDLRELLSEVLLLDQLDVERKRVPNWRAIPSDDVQGRMDWPFDILSANFQRPNRHRLPGWPEEPRPDEDLQAMTRAAVEAAPRLIPIFAHRFLPATPCESGNPVFSMYGTDTIIYGTDLLSYFCSEFKVADPRTEKPPLEKIPFWSFLACGE